MEYQGEVYYYYYNAQGDVLGLFDKNGAKVVEYVYDSWGKMMSVSGSLASTLGQANPFRYRGYYYDAETKLYYLNSRYYDPETGRFLNADGVLGANGDMGTYNLFAYCGNNPVNRIDPNGRFWEEIKKFFRSFFEDYESLSTPTYLSQSNLVRFKGSEHEKFKNPDGSYSLYDNKRGNEESVFHEQILAGKVSGPSFNPKGGKITLGSVKGSVMTGGWEWDYVDLSLLDIGTAKLGLGYADGSFEASAMASAWTPSISFKVWDVNITVSGHVGSVGGEFVMGDGKFRAGAAYGYGLSISIS